VRQSCRTSRRGGTEFHAPGSPRICFFCLFDCGAPSRWRSSRPVPTQSEPRRPKLLCAQQLPVVGETLGGGDRGWPASLVGNIEARLLNLLRKTYAHVARGATAVRPRVRLLTGASARRLIPVRWAARLDQGEEPRQPGDSGEGSGVVRNVDGFWLWAQYGLRGLQARARRVGFWTDSYSR
jgi:hypothetical protein